MKSFSFLDWLSGEGSSSLAPYSSVKSFKINGWVYAAINRIAFTASSAPLSFYQAKGSNLPTYNSDELVVDRNHPVHLLFNPPCYPIILSLRDLLYRTFLHLFIDGKVFWIVTLKNKIPINIDIRDKNALRPIYADPNTKLNLTGWVEVNTKKSFSVQEVLLLQEYNPDLTNGISLDGLSPLKPARISLESELSIGGWNSSFFKTGMKTPLLIQAKGRLTSEQKREIKSEIVNYYSGIDGAHGAMLLQGGVTVTPLSVGTKDVDFIQGKKLNREEILSVFGVPPSLVGLFEYSSYANAREQTQTFWEQTLLPRMNYILDLIQINILNQYFSGIYAKWDLSKVAGLRPDPVLSAPAAKTYFDMGYHPDQISRILGLPELVPDKNFGKIAKQRLQEQLAYQQSLQTLHSQVNNPSNATSSTTDTSTNSTPRKKFYVDALIRKINHFAIEASLTVDRTLLDELWNVLVLEFVQNLAVVEFGLVQFKFLDMLTEFKYCDPDALRLQSHEIATILVEGIYALAVKQ